MKELEKGLKELKGLQPHGKNNTINSQGTEVDRVIGRGSTFREASGGGGGWEQGWGEG